jgi:hypothetical protein
VMAKFREGTSEIRAVCGRSVAPGAMQAALSKHLSKRANGSPAAAGLLITRSKTTSERKLGLLTVSSGSAVSAVSLEQIQVILPGKKHRIVRSLPRSGHTIVRPNLLGSVITASSRTSTLSFSIRT